MIRDKIVWEMLSNFFFTMGMFYTLSTLYDLGEYTYYRVKNYYKQKALHKLQMNNLRAEIERIDQALAQIKRNNEAVYLASSEVEDLKRGPRAWKNSIIY